MLINLHVKEEAAIIISSYRRENRKAQQQEVRSIFGLKTLNGLRDGFKSIYLLIFKMICSKV